MAANFTDRDLLYGILAVQMGLVERDALVAAVREKASAEGRPMGEILLHRGDLTQETKDLVDALVEQHLALNANNAAQSLATLSSVGSLGEDLQTLGVAEVDASLAHLPSTATRVPESTRPDTSSANRDFASGAERFRVVRMHAKGGIGQVSVAVDDELSREVALKELQPRYADDPGSRNRFVLEAEVTGGLEHPGVVPVYGLGHYADGRPFYAMRFIRGDSLQDATETFHRTMGRDPGQVGYELELRKLLRRFIDVCDALEYAHSRGVLHRDLKPGNIMLGRYGETLVVDWGLAKVGTEKTNTESRLPESTLQPASADDSAPTRMGSTIGTPGYMSPEQAAGSIDQLGAASDVYSLGATLYHVLTGRPPFAGADVGVILSAVQSGAYEKPREVNPRIAKSLEAICLKAMARRPHERYGSARALAEDIERHLADEPTLARPDSTVQRIQRWTRRHRGVTLAAAAGLLLVAAVSAVAFFAVSAERDEARTQRDRAVVSEEQARQSAEEAEAARALAEQQEKRAERVAYNSTLSEAGRLLGSDPMMARSLLENEDRCPPALRDFLWHAMHLQTVREKFSVPLDRPNSFAMSYSPAGDVVALGGTTSEVELRDAETGAIRAVLQSGLEEIAELHFSLDGKSLAMVHWQQGYEKEAPTHLNTMFIEVWDLASGELKIERKYDQSWRNSITATEAGFVNYVLVSESEHAQNYPEYLQDTRLPVDEYGQRISRWHQLTIQNVQTGEETTKYFSPGEGTSIQGDFRLGPPVLSCFCENDAGNFIWMYQVDSQQATIIPFDAEELSAEYMPLAARESKASFFGLGIGELSASIQSILDMETAPFEADISLLAFDLNRGALHREVKLGQFQSGMFIDYQRERFVTLDQPETRLAMLLDRRPLVQVVELDHPERIHRIPAHRGDVVSIDFSPDGTRLASVGLDQYLRMWNLEDICAPRKETTPVVENPGRLLLANGKDEVVILAMGPGVQSPEEGGIEPPDGIEDSAGTQESDGSQEEGGPLLFQLERIRVSDGASLATQDFINPPQRNISQRSGFAGAINMINEVVVNSLAGMFSIHPVSTIGTEIHFSDDCKRLVLATSDRLLEFDVETGVGDELWGPLYRDPTEREDLGDISVSHDLKYFATLNPRKKQVRVYDFETRELYWELPPSEDTPIAIQFVPSSQSLVVFGESETEKNTELSTSMVTWDLEAKTSKANNLPAIDIDGYCLFSQDGQQVVVFSKFIRQATVVDATTGETLSKINLARNEPLGMLPGTDLLVLKTEDGGLQFWDTILDQYRTELQLFEGESVAEVVFSRDKKTLVILGDKGSFRLLGADRLRDDLADVRRLMERAPVLPDEKLGAEAAEQPPESAETEPSALPEIEIFDEMPELPPAIQQPAPWQDDEDPAAPLPPAPVPMPIPPAAVADPNNY